MNERILVVDDEESIRFTFNVFLSDENYTVVSASSYDEALVCLKEKPFDLIYADIVMENGTGIDLLKITRELCPEVPVVIITGMPKVETAAEALRHGAIDYIVKPILQEDLLRSTKAVLKQKLMLDEKERAHQNFEAIFHSVKDGIITVDRDMAVVEINDAACRICGIERQKIINKPFRPPTGHCQGKCLEIIKEVLKKQKPLKVQPIECYCNKTTRQVVNLTGSPLTNKEQIITGAVMVVRDETFSVDNCRKIREDSLIIGKSDSIRKVKELIDDLADVHTTVLVTGETGTGKELVVEELHCRGTRRRKALVKVNCAALSENLLESELFGHVSGAYTGAVKDKIGRFQRADGGTLFLDEIGEISTHIQLRLLRFLETMEFERVGDSITMKVDVRVVTATNQDLEKKVAQGEFRRDLYYRLKILEINLSPLHQRREDIPLLVDHFLALFNKKFNKTVSAVSDDSWNLLKRYHWPGNVRELRNAIEQAVVRCSAGVIDVEHLPAELMKVYTGTIDDQSSDMENEAQEIKRILSQARWNKSKAAELMGVNRRTIYRKMKKYGISNS